MRVLLDEDVPHDLIPQFTGHDESTVQGVGWAGIKNGDLLEVARIGPGQVEHVGGRGEAQ